MLGIIPGFGVLGMSACIAGITLKGTEQDIWGQIRPSGVWEKGLNGVLKKGPLPLGSLKMAYNLVGRLHYPIHPNSNQHIFL